MCDVLKTKQARVAFLDNVYNGFPKIVGCQFFRNGDLFMEHVSGVRFSVKASDLDGMNIFFLCEKITQWYKTCEVA